MPHSQFSSFSWRHGGHHNGRRPLPMEQVRTMQQRLTWSRGAPRPLRRWEVKYGVALPLPARRVECHRCHTTHATFYGVQGNYYCEGCMTTLIRRTVARRKQSPPKAEEAVTQ